MRKAPHKEGRDQNQKHKRKESRRRLKGTTVSAENRRKLGKYNLVYVVRLKKTSHSEN